MALIIRGINTLLVLLTLFAGPYRVVAYKLLTFGGKGLGLVTWIGIAAVYPACAFPTVPRRAQPWALGLWLALAVWAYVQMFAKWCATKRRNPRIPHCWFGRGEWFFALAFALAVTAFAGNGAGMFFFAGFWCSTAQLWLLALRGRLERWTPEDTERLLSPLRAGQGRAEALAAWAKQNAPIAGRFALAKSLLACSFTGAALKAAWAAWLSHRAAHATAATAYARPPGFMGRVTSFLVGHAIWSTIIGGLGLGFVFKFIGSILAIPAAILLWMLGGHAELPQFAKDDAQSVFSRMQDGMNHKKDEMLERMHNKWEEGKGRREEITDKTRGAGRKAAWHFFTR